MMRSAILFGGSLAMALLSGCHWQLRSTTEWRQVLSDVTTAHREDLQKCYDTNVKNGGRELVVVHFARRKDSKTVDAVTAQELRADDHRTWDHPTIWDDDLDQHGATKNAELEKCVKTVLRKISVPYDDLNATWWIVFDPNELVSVQDKREAS